MGIHKIKKYYSGIEIVKLDDDYFIVSSIYHSSGAKSMVFKCDQMDGLISLLKMMFRDFPKKDYSDENYRNMIKNLLKIDVDKTDVDKLKSLEEFLKKWRDE